MTRRPPEPERFFEEQERIASTLIEQARANSGKEPPILWDIETIDGDYVHLHIAGVGLLRIPHDTAQAMANAILAELEIFHITDSKDY